MPGPIGSPAGGAGSFDAASLQKLLLALPSFQGQFGNVGVKFNPREALLQQTLLERLAGGMGSQQQVPPIQQTQTVQPVPFGSQPLGILQEQGLGSPGVSGLSNFPFLGRVR